MVNFFTPHPIIPQYMCASGGRFPDFWVVSLTRPNGNLTMFQSGDTTSGRPHILPYPSNIKKFHLHGGWG